ncbi:tail assembly chaperone [Stenotrophomonas phage vB_SmaS_Bhz59]
MVWWYIVVFIVALVVAYSMTPKPQTQPPAGLGDINVPTAEEGREIPVLFGTRDLNGPNVVWYGDLKTVAIRKKGGKK